MARVTPLQVSRIIEWQDGTNGDIIQLEPFIELANIEVNWLDGKDTSGELSDAELRQIEKFLAAHSYTVHRDRQLQSESTNGASGSYQGQTGLGLQATHFGQTAMRLDTTGNLTKRNLESIEGKKVATLTWIGWQDHSKDPYVDD